MISSGGNALQARGLMAHAVLQNAVDKIQQHVLLDVSLLNEITQLAEVLLQHLLDVVLHASVSLMLLHAKVEHLDSAPLLRVEVFGDKLGNRLSNLKSKKLQACH